MNLLVGHEGTSLSGGSATIHEGYRARYPDDPTYAANRKRHDMPTIIAAPALIPVPGGKLIEEFVGRVVSGDEGVSIAQMTAPAGWDEPAQTPQFDEFTVVLEGAVEVETAEGVFTVEAGQAIITRAGERIRYRCPSGARYIAVCLPAFGPDLVHREGE